MAQLTEVQRAKKVRAHIMDYYDRTRGGLKGLMEQLTAYDYGNMTLRKACKQMVLDGFFDIYYVEQAKTLRSWGYPQYVFPDDNEKIWNAYEKEVSTQLYYMAREYMVKHPNSDLAKAFARRL